MSEESWPATTSGLSSDYAAVRATTERLAAPLSAEDQTVQSMPDVSPTKWHRAHVTWFFETFVLAPHLRGYRPYNDAFAYIFNSYYEALGDRHPRPERGLISRPGIAEVACYREFVDEAMGSLLHGELEAGVTELITLGLHHEQQHQELLLMDIKNVLSRNPLRPAVQGTATAPWRGNDDRSAVPKAGWIEHEGGVAEIGHAGRGFGFDNEFPRHRVFLSPFALADRPVTCGEWMSFMEDGGYSRPEFWLSDGWAVVMNQGWQAPLYWFREPERPGQWQQFTLSGVRPSIPMSPCAMSATTRRTPSPIGPGCACPPRRSGRRWPPRWPRATTSWAPARAPIHDRPSRPMRSSVTSGSGRRVPTPPTRASAPRPERSASTTGSSWSASTSCAADAAPRHPGMRAPPIATSSLRERAGRSAAFDWHGIPDRVMAYTHRCPPLAR